MSGAVALPRPGALLGQPASAQHRLGRDLWGFGGVHGGLLLALMTASMRALAPGIPLRSATARFHRALTDEFRIDGSTVRTGRRITTLSAVAVAGADIHAEATGVFAVARPAAWPVLAPTAPVAPPPGDCDVFTVPPEFVPISTSLQIRPVGPHRPYTGGPAPELTAWVRLLEDDLPPDLLRLILILDALAPSYAAVLDTLALIPTVELTVRPSDSLAAAASPWVLLHARTRVANHDGWVDEEIHAWDGNGLFLGSAHQLRLMRSG